MSTITHFDERVIPTWNGKVKLRFKVSGSGPALFFLHPAPGLVWDDFLTKLSEEFTIYAPEFPGVNLADSTAIHQLDDIFDVVLAYEEAIRGLGLESAPVIGASFGGMLAAELSSTFPDLFSKVILLAPAGLWNQTHPWTLDFMSKSPAELANLAVFDPEAPRTKAMFTAPADPAQALENAVASIWSIGCTSKFFWPIPDRGLVKRINRLSAPTLVVWGENDMIIPVAYAHEYGERVANSRVEIIECCGHIPQVECMETTYKFVRDFLG